MSHENENFLDAKQQAIVAISSFTAKGHIEKLKVALTSGLDAGLTINEIKEELLQLYAYCGFPRSLNGMTTFMSVLEIRKGNGIKDVIGKEPAQVVDSNKYEAGKKTLEKLTSKIEDGPKTGVAAFAPGMDIFLKEHLFADIFGRDILSHAQRELVTISALASMEGVSPQLQAHIGMSLNVGITEGQVEEMLSLIESNLGKEQADADGEVLQKP